MKVYFQKMPESPIWWKFTYSDAPYHYGMKQSLTPSQVNKLMKIIKKNCPKAVHAVAGEISETSNRHSTWELKICIGSLADQAFFLLWAQGGIEI
jgi:hypothetical protein